MPDREALTRAWLLAGVLSLVVFAAAPGIDLWVTRQFFDGARFPLADIALLDRLRHLIWNLSILLVLVAAAGFVAAQATGRRALWLPARVWAFVLALYAIGPGLIVNLGLKSHWGRARPPAVAEFGGSAAFSPPLWPADACTRNCSFVSGEAAAAVALAICLIVMAAHLRDRPGPAAMRRLAAAAVVLAVAGAGMRLLTGRHFLSDIVFAGLIVTGVALLLDRLMLRRPAPGGPC